MFVLMEFFLLSQVCYGQTIQTSDQSAEFNRTRGGNFTYQWIVANVKDGVTLRIFKSNTSNTPITKHYLNFSNMKSDAAFYITSPYRETGRFYVRYFHRGFNDGAEHGAIKLKITNLQIEDEGVYILMVLNGPLRDTANVSLNVFAPPQIHSSVLPPYYNIGTGLPHTVNIHLSGKPRPKVTWTLDDTKLAGIFYEHGTYIYIYSTKIPAMKTCEVNKTLRMVAKGYGILVRQSSIISARPPNNAPTIQHSCTSVEKVNQTFNGNLTYRWIVSMDNNIHELELYKNDQVDEIASDILSPCQCQKHIVSILTYRERFYLRYFNMRNNKTAVELRITDLKLEDEGIYRLKVCYHYCDSANFSLNVLAPPMVVFQSSELQPIYEVLSSTPFDITIHLRGNPKPKVTWTLDGSQLLGKSQDIGAYNYSYTVTIPALREHKTHQLVMTAEGYGKHVHAWSTIITRDRDFTQSTIQDPSGKERKLMNSTIVLAVLFSALLITIVVLLVLYRRPTRSEPPHELTSL